VLRCEIPEFPNARSVEKNTKSACVLFHIYFIQHFLLLSRGSLVGSVNTLSLDDPVIVVRVPIA